MRGDAMAQAIGELVDPAHTALVTQECQRGVIGDLSALPELARRGAGDARRTSRRWWPPRALPASP